MQSKIKIVDSFAPMLEAVNLEIEKLKNTKHEVILFEGRLVKQVDGGFIYRFEIPEGTYVRIIEDVEIYVEKEQEEEIKGYLVSVENQFVFIKLYKDQGKIIPHLKIVWRSDMILRKLSQRLSTIMEKPSKFCITTTEQTFYPDSDCNKVAWNYPIIYPKRFNLNDQQQKAMQKALANKVTFVWGPPGTGKTKTLGMIAHNLIKGGKRVLLASNTNRAVDNGLLAVIECYKEYSEDFVKDLTRYGQIALVDKPDIELVSFEKEVEDLRNEKMKKVQGKFDLLRKYKDAKKRLVTFEEQLTKMQEIEFIISQKQHELDGILNQLQGLRTQIDNFDNAGVIEILKRTFTGVTKEVLENRFLSLQKQGRESKLSIEDMETELERIKTESQDFEIVFREFEKIKNQVEELGGEDTLSQEIESELQIDESALLREKKLIASTFAKIVVNDIFWHLRYDALLIDEASMACLPYLASLSALSNEKAIILGDPQQLPPISICEDQACKQWLQKDIYMFAAGKCLTAEDLFRWNEENPGFTTFLNTQYRMASDLCSVISNFFYNGKLKNMRSLQEPPGQIVFIDSSPLYPRTKKISGAKRFKPYNEIHTAKIIEFIKSAVAIRHYSVNEIGIIVPFTGSVEYVREQLRLHKLKNIEVGTIHTFQGREKRVIIFDTVMAGVDYTVRPFDETKTSKDKVCRLLNVALSRSKQDIFIIADMRHFSSKYNNLTVNHLLQRLSGFSVEPSKIEESSQAFEDMSDDEKNSLLGLVD